MFQLNRMNKLLILSLHRKSIMMKKQKQNEKPINFDLTAHIFLKSKLMHDEISAKSLS